MEYSDEECNAKAEAAQREWINCGCGTLSLGETCEQQAAMLKNTLT